MKIRGIKIKRGERRNKREREREKRNKGEERKKRKRKKEFHVHSAYNSFDWGEGVNENSPTYARAI